MSEQDNVLKKVLQEFDIVSEERLEEAADIRASVNGEFDINVPLSDILFHRGDVTAEQLERIQQVLEEKADFDGNLQPITVEEDGVFSTAVEVGRVSQAKADRAGQIVDFLEERGVQISPAEILRHQSHLREGDIQKLVKKREKRTSAGGRGGRREGQSGRRGMDGGDSEEDGPESMQDLFDEAVAEKNVLRSQRQETNRMSQRTVYMAGGILALSVVGGFFGLLIWMASSGGNAGEQETNSASRNRTLVTEEQETERDSSDSSSGGPARVVTNNDDQDRNEEDAEGNTETEEIDFGVEREFPSFFADSFRAQSRLYYGGQAVSGGRTSTEVEEGELNHEAGRFFTSHDRRSIVPPGVYFQLIQPDQPPVRLPDPVRFAVEGNEEFLYDHIIRDPDLTSYSIHPVGDVQDMINFRWEWVQLLKKHHSRVGEIYREWLFDLRDIQMEDAGFMESNLRGHFTDLQEQMEEARQEIDQFRDQYVILPYEQEYNDFLGHFSTARTRALNLTHVVHRKKNQPMPSWVEKYAGNPSADVAVPWIVEEEYWPQYQETIASLPANKQEVQPTPAVPDMARLGAWENLLTFQLLEAFVNRPGMRRSAFPNLNGGNAYNLQQLYHFVRAYQEVRKPLSEMIGKVGLNIQDRDYKQLMEALSAFNQIAIARIALEMNQDIPDFLPDDVTGNLEEVTEEYNSLRDEIETLQKRIGIVDLRERPECPVCPGS